ncbi:hypothetical protein HMPREF3038_00307 [Akkermansia sp. KLE1797]|nr:hypothetical protein HMPREF3038_00307 [Akkermansia sp. KLE1797]
MGKTKWKRMRIISCRRYYGNNKAPEVILYRDGVAGSEAFPVG